jgi:hypothetical protein
VLAIFLAGCGDRSASSGPELSSPSATVAEHAHPSEGPHQGDLVELGNEEYHAELLHDASAGTVTIYILNAQANKQVPIQADQITINAKHGGRPAQFKLMASPDDSDPAGKSSRFISSDKELAESLDEQNAAPQLVLTIDQKPYRGELTHDH